MTCHISLFFSPREGVYRAKSKCDIKLTHDLLCDILQSLILSFSSSHFIALLSQALWEPTDICMSIVRVLIILIHALIAFAMFAFIMIHSRDELSDSFKFHFIYMHSHMHLNCMYLHSNKTHSLWLFRIFQYLSVCTTCLHVYKTSNIDKSQME